MVRRNLYFLIISGFLTPGISSADIGWFGESPGRVDFFAGEHADIRMVEENVMIELTGGRGVFNHVCVSSEFIFTNEGPRNAVFMYIPVFENSITVNPTVDPTQKEILDWYGIDEYIRVTDMVFSDPAELEKTESRGGFDRAIGNCVNVTVSVDGEKTPVEYVLRHSWAEDYALTINGFIRWALEFDAGGTKTISCSYECPYERDDLGDGGNNWYAFRYEYPLYTGNTWKGAIGRGEIKVIYENETVGGPIFFVSPGCPAAEVSADETRTDIEWSFENFEPPANAKIKIYRGNTGHLVPPDLNPRTKSVGLEIGGGEAGVALRGNLPLKEKPFAKANPVAGAENLEKGTPLSVRPSRGEWWYVKLNEGTEGWLRWREVDADTGEEIINATFVGVKIKGY